MIAAAARHRWGCLGALLVLGAAAAVWAGHRPSAAALREHPYFAISQLVITGCGPALTPDDVRTWLGFTGDSSLWDAAPARLRARLAEHPYVAHATVRREFPGRLEIVLRERRPRAIVVLDQLYYVDRGGVTFGPLRPQDSRDYPLVTGLAPAMEHGPRTWALRRALRLLRRCEQAPCVGAVSEVHLDAQRGLVLYPAAPRLPIVLGWGSWSEKLRRADRVVRAWEANADRLAGIDLRFRNQVVLTLRPVPPAPARSGRTRGMRA